MPGIAATWDECSVEAKAYLLKYDHIRSSEESEFQATLAGFKRS